ncbi:tail fiber domain-containing protein [Emticicia sp. BO119]|uniref:tail fiber domain-containing protein n=1 Tax=Emticicia sp. BO119 TaxID=2757768 RepID=UPI0015F0E029|nr:tail fiber domain-containing protein [Emticicia sp. BO119]MBA4850196.1 tail fiber domain-containing protein [Emticicia sp. BO119]
MMEKNFTKTYIGQIDKIGRGFISLLFLAHMNTVSIQAQVFTHSDADGSITISPKGLQGKTNSSYDVTNLALGDYALWINSGGMENTAIGTLALKNNTTGSWNTANGCSALYSNMTGNYNTATGRGALADNISGGWNTADGLYALRDNREGYRNTANGAYALQFNKGGYENTALGNDAGSANISGSNNTFIGYQANPSQSNLKNATAIGNCAIVNASNKVRIGDSTVTVIEGQVPWTNPSDRRLKENIVYTSRLGLTFVKRLQTVSYNFIADKGKTRYDGFIAQDIEAIMQDLKVPFSGLKKAEDGRYSLAYSDFVMPLVNAIKEQQEQIETQQQEIELLRKQLKKVDDLERKIELLAGKEVNRVGK